jgi:hypothetical protein
LKYSYKAKNPDELEALAESLLARFPSCRKNGKTDIEAIVERFPIRIIPRPGLCKLTLLDAYLPHIDDVMLVDADLANDMPLYRLTLAEEISHRLLEPELWASGAPPGANIYQLDPQLYDTIEGDAYKLAIAILMPKEHFSERFTALKREFSVNPAVKDADVQTIDSLAKEFAVTFNGCAYRCEVLGVCRGKIIKTKLPGSVVF